MYHVTFHEASSLLAFSNVHSVPNEARLALVLFFANIKSHFWEPNLSYSLFHSLHQLRIQYYQTGSFSSQYRYFLALSCKNWAYLSQIIWKHWSLIETFKGYGKHCFHNKLPSNYFSVSGYTSLSKERIHRYIQRKTKYISIQFYFLLSIGLE